MSFQTTCFNTTEMTLTDEGNNAFHVNTIVGNTTVVVNIILKLLKMFKYLQRKPRNISESVYFRDFEKY